MMEVLNDIVLAMTYRAEDYREAEDYYEGRVSESFATAELRNALRNTRHRGQHNYIRVVTDAVLNRLEIANILADTKKAQSVVDEVWEENELDLESMEIHRMALKYGECYALVWPDADGDVQISYNSPLAATIVYDPENPRKKQYGVKMWSERHPFDLTMKSMRLNVYTEDKIYKYISMSEQVSLSTSWNKMGEEDNPWGVIPMFHFRTSRPYGVPEGKAGFGAQNDINKLLATHAFTVDYQGAPQRYALGASSVDGIEFNGDNPEDAVANLESSPGNLWYLQGISSVGEFKPADPDIFWKPIIHLKQSLAALTDTPSHYLESGNFRATNGEALRTVEAPLLKKVKNRQASFGTTWREMFDFVLLIEGVNADIDIKWEEVESMDSLDEWDVMLKKINAGLSHKQALREAGYGEPEIERIMEERAEEASASQFYNRTDVNGQQSLQNVPAARVSTDFNAANNQNRNGLSQEAMETTAQRAEDLNSGS